MKQVLFKNIFNGEEVVCADPNRDEQIIEGVKYLIVHKPDNKRTFLMRKDALKKVNNKSKHAI